MKKILITAFLLLASVSTNAQTSAFTYQGKLTDNGAAANGQYDLVFRLFTASSGGTQVGGDLSRDDVSVNGGIFTVNLDFGASPFTSTTGNYLEISVRAGTSTGAYETLQPRQPITSSPYAVQTIRAASALTADNANQLGGLAASQYVQTNDTRMSDARTPTAGSADYIQNTSSQQVSSNFNISGTGRANILEAGSQFNLGGSRILWNGGAGNLFAGFNAGFSTTSSNNAFFGSHAGEANQIGFQNSFFGAFSGAQSTFGNGNSFFGSSAGVVNTTGTNNSFFGVGAGGSNSTGSSNSAFGANAGFPVNGLNNATAIGANASVTQSNSLVLGNGANVGIGTSAPLFKFQVRTNANENFVVRPGSAFSSSLTGMGLQSVNDTNTAYGQLDLEGSQVTMNIGSGGRVGIGTPNPSAALSVVGGGFAANAYIGDGNPTATTLDIENTSSTSSWRFQTNGNGDVTRSGNLEIWKVGGVNGMTIQPDGDIGLGTLAPTAKLEVNGYTKLGSDAPSVRMKKFTGITAATEGNSVTISLGLDPAKIISISVMVSDDLNEWYGPNDGVTACCARFSWWLGGSQLHIVNAAGASSFIRSQPFRVLIIYEQ